MAEVRVGDRLYGFDWINQLGVLLPRNWGRWNWYDIWWCHIATEVGGHEGYKGSWYAELTVVILGVGFRVEYVSSVRNRQAWADDLSERYGLRRS